MQTEALSKTVLRLVLFLFFIARKGQFQVIVTTGCSSAAQAYGAQVVQMCHSSSATSSLFLALDASTGSSQKATECACTLTISGGSAIVFTDLTNISPTTSCGTEIEISPQEQDDPYFLKCSTRNSFQIYGTQVTLTLRKDETEPETGYSFDYCLAVYIVPETLGPQSEVSISCNAPVAVSTQLPVSPVQTQCYTEIQNNFHSADIVAQMCHENTASRTNFVILDIMAAESVMSQEVNECECTLSVHGGNKFGIAQATTIVPSSSCGTKVEIRTGSSTAPTTNLIECDSSSPQILGNSANIVLSKTKASDDFVYNYNYCLSIYIANRVGQTSPYLTLTCFAPKATSVKSTLSRGTSTISPLVSTHLTTDLTPAFSSSTPTTVSKESTSFSLSSIASTMSSTTSSPSSLLVSSPYSTAASTSTSLSSPTLSSLTTRTTTSSFLSSSSIIASTLSPMPTSTSLVPLSTTQSLFTTLSSKTSPKSQSKMTSSASTATATFSKSTRTTLEETTQSQPIPSSSTRALFNSSKTIDSLSSSTSSQTLSFINSSSADITSPQTSSTVGITSAQTSSTFGITPSQTSSTAGITSSQRISPTTLTLPVTSTPVSAQTYSKDSYTSQPTQKSSTTDVLVKTTAESTSSNKDTPNDMGSASETSNSLPLGVIISVPCAVLVVAMFVVCICVTSRKSYIETDGSSVEEPNKQADVSTIEDRIEEFRMRYPEYKSLFDDSVAEPGSDIDNSIKSDVDNRSNKIIADITVENCAIEEETIDTVEDSHALKNDRKRKADWKKYQYKQNDASTSVAKKTISESNFETGDHDKPRAEPTMIKILINDQEILH